MQDLEKSFQQRKFLKVLRQGYSWNGQVAKAIQGSEHAGIWEGQEVRDKQASL